VALKFFTLTAQIAFGEGCDHASYVARSFPNYFPVGNLGDSAMLKL